MRGIEGSDVRSAAAAEPENEEVSNGAQHGPCRNAAVLLATLLAPWRCREERVRALLAQGDLATLAQTPAESLQALAGLSPVQAQRVAAAFALGREVERTRRAPRTSLRSAARVFHLMSPEVRGLECETFHVLILDAKHRLRSREIVSQGTLTASLVHPREVFRAAIRLSAAALVVVHNHPSGDPEPSAEDLGATRRLVEAGRLLGIPLLDHVVIGETGYVSIRERIAF